MGLSLSGGDVGLVSSTRHRGGAALFGRCRSVGGGERGASPEGRAEEMLSEGCRRRGGGWREPRGYAGFVEASDFQLDKIENFDII